MGAFQGMQQPLRIPSTPVGAFAQEGGHASQPLPPVPEDGVYPGMEVKAEDKKAIEHYYAWIRIPLAGLSGQYAYKNTLSGEISNELPEILQKQWEKRVQPPYGWVYYNKFTQQIVAEPPEVPRDEQVKEHEREVQEDSVATLLTRIDQLKKKNKRVGLSEQEWDEVAELENFLSALPTAKKQEEKTQAGYAKLETSDGL